MTGTLLLAQFTSTSAFIITAQTWLRVLGLNIAFNGAIHYGIGAALYEISTLNSMKRENMRQILYSFVPGVSSFAVISWILLSDPLTMTTVVSGFALLSLIQTLSARADYKYISRKLLPKWYKRTRTLSYLYLMMVTGILFTVWFSQLELLQKKADNTRIQTIKEMLEMSDIKFLQAVNSSGIQYDESEMILIDKKYRRVEDMQEIKKADV